MEKHKIVIVDDHSLFAESLQSLINNFSDFEVQYIVKNGQELIDKLTSKERFPDIILLDINMPVMNGAQTMSWLKNHQPELDVLALSMEDNEETVIKMLRYGAKGYLLKDIHPDELQNALHEVISKGFYYTDKVNNSLIKSLNLTEGQGDSDFEIVRLNDREKTFLEYACTEKTYKEIADDMFISPKTVDGYRDSLFKKFGVSNRIGLVLYAFKNELVKI